MRVERVRERIHEGLEHVVALDLIHALQEPLVAFLQDLVGLFPRLLRQCEIQSVVLYAQTPYFVELLAGGGPGQLAAVELVFLVDIERGLGFQLGQREGQALTHPGAIDVEHLEHGVERLVTRPHEVIELISILLEILEVALQEIKAVAIERFDVTVEHARGQIVVDGQMVVVRLLDELRDELADLFVPQIRREDVIFL